MAEQQFKILYAREDDCWVWFEPPTRVCEGEETCRRWAARCFLHAWTSSRSWSSRNSGTKNWHFPDVIIFNKFFLATRIFDQFFYFIIKKKKKNLCKSNNMQSFTFSEPSTSLLKIPSDSMAKSMDEGREARFFFRVRESIRNMIMMEMKDKASLITNIKKRDVESPKSSMCSHICDIFYIYKTYIWSFTTIFLSFFSLLPAIAIRMYTYLLFFFFKNL